MFDTPTPDTSPQAGGQSPMARLSDHKPPLRLALRARHLSPACGGADAPAARLAPIRSPTKWGRGVEGKARDGEGEIRSDQPYAIAPPQGGGELAALRGGVSKDRTVKIHSPWHVRASQ